MVFQQLQIIFNNLYISSSYLNLTAQGLYPNSRDSKEIKIRPADGESTMKATLYMHLLVILAFSGTLSWSLYYFIRNQHADPDEYGKDFNFSRKNTLNDRDNPSTSFMETTTKPNIEVTSLAGKVLRLSELPKDRSMSNKKRLSVKSQIIEISDSQNEIKLTLEEIAEKSKEE